MPFESTAQQGYLFKFHPEVAKQFAKETPKADYANLPEHVGDKKKASGRKSRTTSSEKPPKHGASGGARNSRPSATRKTTGKSQKTKGPAKKGQPFPAKGAKAPNEPMPAGLGHFGQELHRLLHGRKK